MPKRLSFAHGLLAAGLLLGLAGLGLWWWLPIPSALPPFLFTALLAIGFGLWELRRAPRDS